MTVKAGRAGAQVVLGMNLKTSKCFLVNLHETGKLSNFLLTIIEGKDRPGCEIKVDMDVKSLSQSIYTSPAPIIFSHTLMYST